MHFSNVAYLTKSDLKIDFDSINNFHNFKQAVARSSLEMNTNYL